MAIVESAPSVDAQRRAAGLPPRGFFRRRFGKWIALSQYGFPFAIGRYATPVGRFRALARRSRFAGRPARVRLAAVLAMTLCWPFGAFATVLRTWRITRSRGRHYGLSQFVDMYWLALRHNIPPLEYGLYRFDDPAQRNDMHEYVYWNDLPALAALTELTAADNRDVQDKARFADICTQHGLPHAPTLAVFERGKQEFPAAPFFPDAPALWIKSLRLKGGDGGAKWIRDGESYRNMRGDRVSATALGELFRKQDCIVQPFIENHPAIAAVSNGALATLRIVTGINERGEAEFVTALMGLPHGAYETSAGAICCSLDRATGQIRCATLLSGDPVTRHPDTGIPIVGVVLPNWRNSVDLARCAHAGAFSRFPFLGWDIALTKDGPILLETNSGWGAIFHQTLDGPLGHTAFSRLVSQYV